jgi:hypothetical protein
MLRRDSLWASSALRAWNRVPPTRKREYTTLNSGVPDPGTGRRELSTHKNAYAKLAVVSKHLVLIIASVEDKYT